MYDADLAGRTLIASFMTLAELDRWTIQSKWGEARRNWLRLYLEPFAVMPYNRALCTKWAEVTVSAQANGHRIECAYVDLSQCVGGPHPIPAVAAMQQNQPQPTEPK